MLKNYLKQTEFSDFEDFTNNYKLLVPEHFNFAYDIVDARAEKEPNKLLCWTNDKGECRHFLCRNEVLFRPNGFLSAKFRHQKGYRMAILSDAMNFGLPYWFAQD